jgi:fructose-1,6-bisphosphatase/inositol monophosphatase family enzyme
MRLPDIARVTVIIEETVRTIVMPRFRDLPPEAVFLKAPGDFVTEVDRASEAHLTTELSALLPGSAVVGEEAYAADHGVLGRLDGDAPVWIVDPLDGTWNFVHGRERFGAIVALVQSGRTMAGWIHLAAEGRTAVAVAGEGAWLNGRRLRVSIPRDIKRLRGGVNVPPERFPSYRAGILRLRAMLSERQETTCAAYDYAEAADGAVDLLVYRNLHPWDHAAGILLHAEAGGHSALFDGSPYRPTVRRGPVMIAPDAATWAAARDVIGIVELPNEAA